MLVCLAMLILVDTVAIECRHAAIRRGLVLDSVQTHVPKFLKLSCTFILQQLRNLRSTMKQTFGMKVCGPRASKQKPAAKPAPNKKGDGNENVRNFRTARKAEEELNARTLVSSCENEAYGCKTKVLPRCSTTSSASYRFPRATLSHRKVHNDSYMTSFGLSRETSSAKRKPESCRRAGPTIMSIKRSAQQVVFFGTISFGWAPRCFR